MSIDEQFIREETPYEKLKAQYDALKQRNDELVEALIWADERINKKAPHASFEQCSEYNLRMFALMKQALKNNSK